MDKVKQNEAIATALGWVKCEVEAMSLSEPYWHRPGEDGQKNIAAHRPPMYLNDLNAMHSIITALVYQHNLQEVLLDTLVKMLDDTCLEQTGQSIHELTNVKDIMTHIVITPAETLAEGLLKTLNLWED